MPRYSSRSWRAFRPQDLPAAVTLEARDCRVLGLDPGSQRTGFGIIDCRAGTESHVASGCIDVAGADMVVRLQRIHAQLCALVAQHRPDMVAIERVFLHRNPDSALKLGQARGVALCAAASQGASVHEYAPRAIKLAVTGYGAGGQAAGRTDGAHAAGARGPPAGRCGRRARGGALPFADAAHRRTAGRAARGRCRGGPGMIGSLAGVIGQKAPPQLLLEVGGVGYELEAPMSTFYGLPAGG